MKFIIILSILLASCGTNYTVKRVKDGAILKVKDFEKRNFKVGDTVYITEISTYSDGWQISTDTWTDTIYCYSDTNYAFCWSYKAAVIK